VSMSHQGNLYYTLASLNCNHEDADTRIVVHVRHAMQQGMRCIEVRTIDTLIPMWWYHDFMTSCNSICG
jgi:hypothetical protein